jgi:hypothetical protein
MEGRGQISAQLINDRRDVDFDRFIACIAPISRSSRRRLARSDHVVIIGLSNRAVSGMSTSKIEPLVKASRALVLCMRAVVVLLGCSRRFFIVL